MKFYDRENETAELKRICNLSFTRNSRMTVLAGRRRIGKTSLISGIHKSLFMEFTYK
ncbi:hypothetical protein [uncultured Bacteroides sp.]|uniref:hypothetical protein n=1 Tax=uncultured Bacteroides sp. TaxID=162156 RepID=UPI0023CEB4DF|nr:hypothetical protein [uncultured Bacteroides sp.]MDE5761597.1 hypothetical protein [Bacteroides sp.]